MFDPLETKTGKNFSDNQPLGKK